MEGDAVRGGASGVAGAPVLTGRSASRLPGLTRASQLERATAFGEGEQSCEPAPDLRGSIISGSPTVEIVGNGRLTAAAMQVAAFQAAGGAAVWVSGREDTFFPPDLAANGVDLTALPVVMVRERRECVEAVDTLMRSRFFSLIVADWREEWLLEGAIQARFVRLGRRHGVTLLFLTEAQKNSSVALLPLRLLASRQRRGIGSYVLTLEVVRDKLGVRIPRHEEPARGPDGLR
ncbi:MAG: hypothetical protein ACLFP6_01050 [Spirochaetaceae bacterium]